MRSRRDRLKKWNRSGIVEWPAHEAASLWIREVTVKEKRFERRESEGAKQLPMVMGEREGGP